MQERTKQFLLRLIMQSLYQTTNYILTAEMNAIPYIVGIYRLLSHIEHKLLDCNTNNNNLALCRNY